MDLGLDSDFFLHEAPSLRYKSPIPETLEVRSFFVGKIMGFFVENVCPQIESGNKNPMARKSNDHSPTMISWGENPRKSRVIPQPKNIQVSPGNVKLHFSQRQGGGPPGASPTHSLRCPAMPWRLRRKVRLQLGQKKAMAKWSETSDINHFHEVMVEFIHKKYTNSNWRFLEQKKADEGRKNQNATGAFMENEGNAECIFVATIGWSPTVSCHYPKFPPLNVFKQNSQKSVQIIFTIITPNPSPSWNSKASPPFFFTPNLRHSQGSPPPRCQWTFGLHGFLRNAAVMEPMVTSQRSQNEQNLERMVSEVGVFFPTQFFSSKRMLEGSCYVVCMTPA